MGTSHEGVRFIERHEGVVLRAYRDVAGVWTIGAGLTAASGVVTPKHGMVITKEEASRLLALALTRNYAPAVRNAMPGARQHEFDGALSFHFNTGAIGRASWVAAWKARDRKGVATGLAKWVRGGGKVLPGLVRRRKEEADLINGGVHEPSEPLPKHPVWAARITLRLSDKELAAARAGFRSLGYDPGDDPRHVALMAVINFQRDHDLTVDGIVGRATLTTLQRRLDARRLSARTAVAGGGGAAATQAPGVGETLPDTAILAGAGIVTVLVLLWLAWRYRDMVAAKLQRVAPRTATWLRSR
ncbi:glycoside hydrolase family protein [Albidovulum sp.]|uniref:glycoside hydrolase family protein n=1 Tax=Albidovulum sp. TaxID=1872424 RepID=UPI0039B9481D